MTEGPVPAGPLPRSGASSLDDWITIWHSELAAAVLDREAQETLLQALDAWAAAARLAVTSLDARTHAPPGSPPATASPDPRDAYIAELLARVGELERRLAAA